VNQWCKGGLAWEAGTLASCAGHWATMGLEAARRSYSSRRFQRSGRKAAECAPEKMTIRVTQLAMPSFRVWVTSSGAPKIR
jgi:hypothetical protein